MGSGSDGRRAVSEAITESSGERGGSWLDTSLVVRRDMVIVFPAGRAQKEYFVWYDFRALPGAESEPRWV